MNQLREKVQAYHINIRKSLNEKQKWTKRIQFIQMYQQGCFDHSNIQSQSLRYERLNQISVILRQKPSTIWKSVIQQLSQLIKQEINLKKWRDEQIIACLLQVFEPEYKSLQLTSKVSNICSYYIWKAEKTQQRQLITDLMKNIVNQNTIYLLVQFFQENHDPINNNIEELYFLGNIIGENGFLRNKAVEAGIVKKIIDYFQQPLENQHLSLLAWVSSTLLKFYPQPEHQLKYVISNPFVSISIDILNKNTYACSKEDAVSILYSIVCTRQNEAKNIFHLGGVKALVKYGLEGDIDSETYWKLLFQITKHTLQAISNEFMNTNGIDLIQKLLKRKKQYPARKYIFQTVFNLVNNTITADTILRSSILDRIMDSCTNQKLVIRIRGYQIFQRLSAHLRFSQFQYLLKRYDIIEMTYQQLKVSTDPHIKSKCILILYYIVYEYSNIYDQEKNKIVEILLGKYQIQTLLLDIVQKCPNQNLTKKAEDLLELISNHA